MQSTAVRGLLLLLLAANLLLNATFVVLFVLNPVDYCLTSREVRPYSRMEGWSASGPRKSGPQHRNLATFDPEPIPDPTQAVDYVDVSFVWVQMGAGLVTATLGFTAFSFALRPVAERRRAERLLTIAALLLVGMAVCSVGLVAPVSDGRRRAVRLLIGAQALCGALAATSAYRARKRSKRLPVDLEDIETAPAFRHLFQDAQGRPSLERLEHLLEMRSVRRSIRAELRSGNAVLSWFGLVLALLSLCGWQASSAL